MRGQELEAEEGDKSIVGEDGTCVLRSLSGNIWLKCNAQVECQGEGGM